MSPVFETSLRRRVSDKLAALVSDEQLTTALTDIQLPDEGLGYDRFGAERETFELAMALCRWLHTSYFRVRSSGAENLVDLGPFIMTPNLAGPLPVGAAVLMVDAAMSTSPRHFVRPVVNRILSELPFVGVALSRAGCVYSSRAQLGALLSSGQSLMLFPEGLRAVAKPFARRLRLLPFKTSAVELALRYRVPIVPVGVLGVEESSPVLAAVTIPLRDRRLPIFPITPTFPMFGPVGLVPLPTHISIRYGAPLHLHEELTGTLPTPTMVQSLTDRLQSQVQDLVADLRRDRGGSS